MKTVVIVSTDIGRRNIFRRSLEHRNFEVYGFSSWTDCHEWLQQQENLPAGLIVDFSIDRDTIAAIAALTKLTMLLEKITLILALRDLSPLNLSNYTRLGISKIIDARNFNGSHVAELLKKS